VGILPHQFLRNFLVVFNLGLFDLTQEGFHIFTSNAALLVDVQKVID
jgi:hypothetical protein